MELNSLLKHTSEWLKGSGPNSEIVISSRIRLARNLNKLPFPNQADKKEAQDAAQVIIKAVSEVQNLKNAAFFNIAEIDSTDRQFLVERHLMSQEHALNSNSKFLVVDPQEIISIMINEEDHLRMQVMQSGLDLLEAWHIMSEIDDNLSKKLDYAFSSEWGYLTACPTNTGTGMRGSVMLHLPVLVMTRQINKVLAAVSKLSFTTRGLYGEGTQAAGNFFQISNQVSLGHSEMEIIDNINGLIRQVIEQEQQARNVLLEQHRAKIEDRIWRSYGTLRNAHIISSAETTELLSMVRLGLDLEIIKDIDRRTVNELFILTQPAHLQKMENKKFSPAERDVKRAEIIRSRLTKD